MLPEIPADLHAALGARYQLRRVLGRGGMATVYLAYDAKHRRDVAVRVLLPGLAAFLGVERFLKEPALALIVPLWLATTYATARTVYRRSTNRRAKELEGLADRLAELVRELVPERPRLPR